MANNSEPQRSSHTLRTDFITSAGTAFLKFPITVCVSKAPTGLRYYTNARSKNLRALTLWPKRCSKIQSKPVWQLTIFFYSFAKERETRETFPTVKTKYFESKVATSRVDTNNLTSNFIKQLRQYWLTKKQVIELTSWSDTLEKEVGFAQS